MIKNIQQRFDTILRVAQAIAEEQQAFFEQGELAMKPMVLRSIANRCELHGSTVSRVTTNKYILTPRGTFELKYFFNSSINAADGSDSLASEAVKEKNRQMIQKEDQRNPLSDQKIVELLRTENIDIARRTVAKYRDMLGILSSGKRKKVI